MNLLIALFAIAAAVWMVPVVATGRIIVVAMIALGVGTIFGPYFFAYDGPIQLSIDRFIWILLFGMVMVGWRTGNLNLPTLSRIDILILAIVGWFFVSALRGGPMTLANSAVSRWLFYIAVPAGMYAIARLTSIQKRDVRLMLSASIGLGLYLAITAMFEVAGTQALIFPRFIADPEIWHYFGRGRGPLLNPTVNGILMSIALVAGSLGILYSRSRENILFLAVAILILLGGVYATLTRSAWLGACAAVGMVGIVYSPRWLRVVTLLSLVVLTFATVTGLKDEVMQMKRDKYLSASEAANSVKLRPLLAVVAWEMLKDRPITGHGFGHYIEHSSRYHSIRSYELPLEQARRYSQHSLFFSVLVDTGAVGFLMFGSLIAMLSAIGWQLARSQQNPPEARWIGTLTLGLIAAYVCNGLFHDVLVIPMVHMFLFFLFGVAVTVYQRGFKTDTLAEVPDPIRAKIAALS